MKTDKLIIGILVFLAVAVVTVILFGFLTEEENRQLFLVLLVIPIAVIIFTMPRTALIILSLVVYTVPWLSTDLQIIPRQTVWAIDALILLMIFRALFHRPFCRHPRAAIEKYILFVLVFILISSILNHTTREILLMGLRLSFRYLGLFLAVYHFNLSRRWIRGYIIFLLLIGLIQIPVVIAQYSVYGEAGFGDPMGGTFGDSQPPAVSFVVLILFCYFISKMIEQNKFRFGYLFLLLGLTICPVLGEVKFFFLLIPFLLLFMVRSEAIRQPALAVGLLVFGVMIVIAVDFFVVQTGGWLEGRNPLTFFRQLPEVWRQQTSERSAYAEEKEFFERGYRWIHAVRLGAETPKQFFFGAGVGAITETGFSDANEATLEYYGRWGLSSRTTYTIPWFLIEFGYLGTFLMLMTIYYIYRRGRILRNSSDEELRIYGRTLESMSFLFIAYAFYSAPWQNNFMSFTFWSLAAILVRLSYHGQETVSEETAAAVASDAPRKPAPETAHASQSG